MLYSRQLGWYWLRHDIPRHSIGKGSGYRTIALAAHSVGDAVEIAKKSPVCDLWINDVGVFDMSLLQGCVQHQGNHLKIYPDGVICHNGDLRVDRDGLVLWSEATQQRVQWYEVEPEFAKNLPDEQILQAMLGYREKIGY